MDELYRYLDRLSQGRRLSLEDRRALPDLFDRGFTLLESSSFPKNFKLASGIIARGATGKTALNAYLLLLARKAYGTDYMKQDTRMHNHAQYLALHIMRANFTHGTPKGIYCCPTCTLSVFPLYCIHAFKWFDCDLLKKNVLEAYENHTSVFSRKFNEGYGDWAMRFA